MKKFENPSGPGCTVSKSLKRKLSVTIGEKIQFAIFK